MRFIFTPIELKTWQDGYGTNNTTVDGNEFIKTASPVIKIFANGHECMPEAEGCCVKRIATGEYLITGCVGLNSDAAWGGIDGGFEIGRRNRTRIWRITKSMLMVRCLSGHIYRVQFSSGLPKRIKH
ncbi:phage tail fiber protein [Citrobacter freundii]|uniref:phage tail fiber protein n=1 Tax=Citrobacter freundii TaxID=546 RepID=UPI0016463B4E|nr:hypothetical protein [Citrobacter freundii]